MTLSVFAYGDDSEKKEKLVMQETGEITGGMKCFRRREGGLPWWPSG